MKYTYITSIITILLSALGPMDPVKTIAFFLPLFFVSIIFDLDNMLKRRDEI